MKKILNFLLAISFIFMSAYSSEIPEIISVHDNAKILSDATKKYITTQNEELSKKCGAKIIFLTENLTDENSVKDYAKAVFNEWGIKSIGRNNSVFVFLSPNKRDYTAVVAEGISASLTNMLAEQNLIYYMEPDFDKKNYDDAVIKTYNAFASWYNSNYNNVSLNLTEDLAEYEEMADYEKKEARIKTAGILAIIISAIIAAMIITISVRRNLRMKRLEKRRLERKKRYMKARQKTY